MLKNHTFSRAMCWAAIERGARLARRFGRSDLADTWSAIAARERDEVLSRGYSQKLGFFTQALDGQNPDASNLLLPSIGLLDARDERFTNTLRAYEERLVEQGFHVKALAQYNSFNSWGWLDDVVRLKDIEVLSGDVRDPHYCKHVTKGVDVVFHLAALIAIPYSYHSPDTYVDTNIKGTLNIVQAARDLGVRRVLNRFTKPFVTYGFSDERDYHARGLKAEGLGSSFEVYDRRAPMAPKPGQPPEKTAQ